MQTNYVCIVENHVTLLVIVQRSKCITHPRPFLSIALILKILEMKMFGFNKDCETRFRCIMRLKWSQPHFKPNILFIILITIKCNKSMIMKTEMLVCFGAF
jgi:hypothetical protein